MTSSRYLFVFIVSFLSGVFVESLVGFGFTLALFAGGFCFLAPAFGYSRIAGVVVCLAFSLGVVRYDVWDSRLVSDNQRAEDGASFGDTVEVIIEPRRREKDVVLVVEPENNPSNLLVRAPLYPSLHIGDIFRLSGTLRRIRNFTPDFDYESYRRVQGVLYEVRRPVIQDHESKSGFSLSLYLQKMRSGILGIFSRALPEPHASLLGGITIGSQDGLDEVAPLFRTVGLSHLVVLSGYNITLVAKTLFAVFGSIGFFWGIWGGIIGVVLFTLMAGLGASSLRAALMAILALLARSFGREYDAGRALLYAVFLMVLWNPSILVYDISFQLSVLATLGVLYFPGKVEPYFQWITERAGLREAAVTTTAAQILVLPFIIYRFGTLSLVSLPLNVLVLPIIPIVMLLGSVLAVVGSASSFIGSFVALPIFVLLEYILNLSFLFAKIPFVSISLGAGSLGMMVIMYAVIACFFYPSLWKR